MGTRRKFAVHYSLAGLDYTYCLRGLGYVVEDDWLICGFSLDCFTGRGCLPLYSKLPVILGQCQVALQFLARPARHSLCTRESSTV
jgi:hypothetical protein